MKRVLSTLFIWVLFVFSPQIVHAELFINEFSSGDSNDWVELYNSGPGAVTLSDYILWDGSNSTTNQLEPSGTIEPNTHLALDWSNKLNNSGDNIKLLLKADATVVSEIGYGNEGSLPLAVSGQSVGRQPDGAGTWVLFSSPTKQTSNNTATLAPTATLTPSPTSEPSKTPMPTKTPTPSLTSTPTVVPTRVPTARSITKSVSNTKSPRPSISQQVVLGEKTAATPSVEPTTLVKDVQSSPLDLGTILLTVGGIFLIACGILSFYTHRKRVAQ